MIDLVYVTAPGCRHCAHGRGVLEELGTELPLRWREVELDSEEGRAMLARWRAPFPPMLVAEDPAGQSLLGHGRLSRRRLARQLAVRSEAAADAGEVSR